MLDDRTFFKLIRRQPSRFYLIHYSSQSLFDTGEVGLSPRITSIVVMHYATQQVVSFALHAVAESLHILNSDIELNYDKIEGEMLKRFYDFARDRREKYWVHWNMKNLTYGFEHLEHRYRVLCNKEPPSIPVELRLNLTDALSERYGSDYAPRPKMLNLMLLNGERIRDFLTGEEESDAFKQQQFIRINTSTLAKVDFFRYVISLVIAGKLKTAGSGFLNFVDRLLEGRWARVAAFFLTIVGVITLFYGILKFMISKI